MKKASVVALVVSLLFITTLSATQVNAQSTGSWITSYTIADLNTGQVLQEGGQVGSPVLAGVALKITITIQVTSSNPGTSLRLSTTLDHSSQPTYWELPSDDFPGISRMTYNPNQQSINFNQTLGTLVIYCYGTIPAGVTQTQVSGITFDKQVNRDLITITDPAGNKLDAINVNVVDAKINEFANRLAAAQSQIQNLNDQGVDPAYIALYQSVIEGATSMANAGLVDVGISSLAQLAQAQNAYSPASTNTPIEATLFLPAVIVLVVIVVLVGFMFMRVRGKVSYDKLVIEDQIKDLEGLTLRAAKIDKNLTINLESVKDRLKNLVEV
jgi:hypothetical protein